MAKKSTEGFKRPDRDSVAEPPPPINVSHDKPGSLAPPPMTAELIEPNKGDQLFDLIEQASQLVSGFTVSAKNQLQETETMMTRLISGEMSIEELASQYGELSTPEAEAAKSQLARVMNAIAVESDKIDVQTAGIKLQAKRAFAALTGLEEGFKLQAKGEKVADARDEAQYQGEVRNTKNIARDQDIDYRIGYNQLDKEEKDDRLKHKEQMNGIGDQFRQAVRRGANAGLKLKQTQTNAKVNRIDRIIGKPESPKPVKKGG